MVSASVSHLGSISVLSLLSAQCDIYKSSDLVPNTRDTTQSSFFGVLGDSFVNVILKTLEVSNKHPSGAEYSDCSGYVVGRLRRYKHLLLFQEPPSTHH